MGFSPPQQRSLIPQCHIETVFTFGFLKERGKKSCLVRTQQTENEIDEFPGFQFFSRDDGLKHCVFKILTYIGSLGVALLRVFLALFDYFS